MYRLVKSEVIPVHHALIKSIDSYREVQLHHFQKLEAALTACEIYNDRTDSCFYIINEAGKKYHEGVWVDCAEL